MARRQKRKCRWCGLSPSTIDGLCPSCLDARAKYWRKKTGRRLLGKAVTAGTEIRDGQEFTIKVLPAQKRYYVRMGKKRRRR